jgi:exo-1,4-beta-D-glucosaminidase
MRQVFGPHFALGAAAVLAAASAVSAPGAQAVPLTARPPVQRAAGPAPHHRASPAVSSPSGTGASDITNLGADGWKVASSATATQSGAQISTPGFNTSSWLPVSNDDAGAPGTEMEALRQNGDCPDVFFSNNMQVCYGQMTKIGPDSLSKFDVPWWWRTDFTLNLQAGQVARLIVNGVVGSANAWVNGTEVATSATVTGAYTRFSFDITPLIRPGTNSLAIEINPNNPKSMYTLDNVDWTQIPPDNNTGIQFPVQLAVDGALSDASAHVLQANAADLSSSALTVKTDIANNTSSPQAGLVTATITPPGGGTPITVSQAVTVAAGTTQTVTFDPARFPALTISNPQVWWPYQLGPQPLYTLTTSVSQGSTVLNSTSETFGIRTVTSYLTGSSAAEPSGTRAFKINGVPVVIRGGGFDPNLFLHYSAADIAKQIALMKNMGVNAIRLEGHIMPSDFFEQMDQAGILVNAGFQCCDRWQKTSGLKARDYAIQQLSGLTIGQNLRNHPSVFSFQWSDNAPSAPQESAVLTGFRQADFQDPIISSAEYKSSAQLGPAGEKEGPYDWVPPDYWYDTTHFSSTNSTVTNEGGSWGYDSEQSAGNTVPTLDSLHRFMSASDLANLWQTPNFNQYHLNYEGSSHQGYHFGTLYNFDKALRTRYGPWPGLDQYVEEAQVQNYENVRAQFEAFIDHAGNTPLPSTGTSYWQLNKGWPSLLWTLYNNDSDQAGSYFGAQEADRTVHALYALDTGTVTLDNLGRTTQSGLSVQAKVYNLAGTLLGDHMAGNITLTGQQVLTNVLAPAVPAVTVPPAPARVYFVELLLRNSTGTVVDRNVYWLSTQQDIVNWPKTLGRPQGKLAQYANLQALHTLPHTSVSVTATTTHQPGPAGADLATTVTITNPPGSPAVAFFLRADVRRGTASGRELPGDNELQSSIWTGNDITLFPGESQTLTVTYNSADLHGAAPVISVSGWNTAKQDVLAPVP